MIQAGRQSVRQVCTKSSRQHPRRDDSANMILSPPSDVEELGVAGLNPNGSTWNEFARNPRRCTSQNKVVICGKGNCSSSPVGPSCLCCRRDGDAMARKAPVSAVDCVSSSR